MAKRNLLGTILNTIDSVQKLNKSNPKEKTAESAVFDLLRDNIGNIEKKIQKRRAKKGKKPLNIMDMVKKGINAAQKTNKKDKKVATAPDSVFDKIRNKVDEAPKRAATSGINKIVDEYNLDVSGITRSTMQQIKAEYQADIQGLNEKYALAIHDLVS